MRTAKPDTRALQGRDQLPDDLRIETSQVGEAIAQSEAIFPPAEVCSMRYSPKPLLRVRTRPRSFVYTEIDRSYPKSYQDERLCQSRSCVYDRLSSA